MTNAFGSKPPAVAWLGQFFVPIGYRLDHVEVALLVSVVLCQILSVALVYAAVRRLTHSLLAAVCAAVTLAGAPLFTALSHEYLADPIATLAVCWMLFVMASAHKWRFGVLLTQMLSAMAFGLLSKLSTPLFMAAPVAATLLIAWRNRQPRGNHAGFPRDRGFILSTAAAGVLSLAAFGWYRNNLGLALEHARTVNSTLWGRELPYTTQLEFWSRALLNATFLPYFAILVATVIGVAILASIRGNSFHLRVPSPDITCLLACLATVTAVTLVVSRQVAQETRYILPLVAILALCVGIVVGRSRHRVAGIAILVLVSLQFAASTAQSFGATLKPLAYARIRAPVNDRFYQTLERIVTSTCTLKANYRISVVGVDYPWLNANTLSLLADETFGRRDRQCHYTPLGLAEQDSERAFQRLLTFKPPYYISLDYDNPNNPLSQAKSSSIVASDLFNTINREVHRRVLGSGLFEILPGSRRDGIVILRARDTTAS